MSIGASALRVTGATALLLWLVFTVPLAAGRRTLFIRDVFGIHLPLKALGAAELRQGRVPASIPSWGLGQPFRGNPQALAFYPGNLLYLALPFWSAFNLHYALHWLLAAVAMYALARRLGQGEGGALTAAITYAAGGVVLSGLTFYNLLTVLAWWPLVLLGAARGGAKGVALGGIACGLALLGGEPVSAALGLVPLALVACDRWGVRRGALIAVGICGLGALVALPQFVATARILPFTFRGGHGLEASMGRAYGFSPVRLLELLIPLPFGWPARSGAAGFWAYGLLERLPFFLSLHVGAIGLLLALAASRRRRLWAGLAGAGVLLSWLGGHLPDVFTALSMGLFRYPEKFLIWFALAVALLAGWGFERRAVEKRWPAAEWVGAGVLLLAALVWIARRGMLRSAEGAVREVVALQGVRWALALSVSGILLWLAAMAVRRGLPWMLPCLQLAGLLQLWPLTQRLDTVPFRQPPEWMARIAPATAVASPSWASPAWAPEPPMPSTAIDLAAMLDPSPNIRFGLRYPTAPDFEGLSSPFHTLLLRNLALWGWEERVHWLRALGVEALVSYSDPGVAGLELLDIERRPGFEGRLYRVLDPAPPAWWPAAVKIADSPVVALGEVLRAVDPMAAVVSARAVDHSAGGRVDVVEETPDRLRLRVSSDGGLAVVRRAYHPLWRARAGERQLNVVPANLVMLGVEVPSGEREVVLEVSAWPEAAAAAFALVALVGALVVLASPARPMTGGYVPR